MNGKNIIIKLDGSVVAGCRSNDIETNADILKVASPTQGQWEEAIAGRKSWSFTTNYLVLSSSHVADLLQVGTTFAITVCTATGTTLLTGSAILKKAKQTYTLGNLCQGSFQFQGTGALSAPQSS